MNAEHLIQCLVSSKCSVNLNYIIIIILLVMKSKTPGTIRGAVLLRSFPHLWPGDTDEPVTF